MYNLLQALFSTMRFEPQPKRRISTHPVADVVKLESEGASPKTSCKIPSKGTTKSSKTKHDIAGDIKCLEQYFFGGHPMQSGFVIETTLHDLLAVCPRNRRRSDAYKSLTNALSKMGVELIILSNKENKNAKN